MLDHGVPAFAIKTELHVTIYEANCILPNLQMSDETISEIANADETRFMVMAAGGEVFQPHLVPNKNKIGIRLTRRNQVTAFIDETRQRFGSLETPKMLSTRKRTTGRHSAFGAPKYQPHMTLLDPGNELPSDLSQLGNDFRATFSNLVFNRLEIRLRD
ncbi:MAG: hypothetical protein ACKO3T_22165 [Planctomycetaceae bacterium]